MRDVQHCGFENLTTIISAIMAPPDNLDLETLGTPETCVADFCLIPVFLQLRLEAAKSNLEQIGTPTASVSQEVADVQRLMQKSNLTYSMHSAGTTVG